ncbi:DEBR0S1_16248g1_1 [Brettanomyces bruxellensis]|uniref:DEBR0S1_16248g1_1 n=1 Tax=Dekkera bruxellensis TaxID=5007 RepID=A0A7D9CVW2_DEKBR|nr:DEBR0S1_16248g1_1 [Brettanomyces bruxellensis]
MLRSITSSSIKQGQRYSAKAFQHQQASGPHQPQRFFTNFVEQQQPGLALPQQQQAALYPADGQSARMFSTIQSPSAILGAAGTAATTGAPAATAGPGSPAKAVAPGGSTAGNAATGRLLKIFDQCLKENSTYDLATGRISGGVDKFWDAVRQIIPIYRELAYAGVLKEKRMAEFVSLLRNGLRIHRLELSKMKKNLDKDANNPIKDIHHLLTCAIREVSYNLLDGLVVMNSHGLTHLFKAYKDLGFTYEAVHIWETGKNNPDLHKLFTSEPVLGSIFPFLVESGDFDFEEVWDMYSQIKASKAPNEKLHNELQVGMIRVCLFKERTNYALQIFKQLTEDVYSTFNSKGVEPPINVKSYMTMAHLSFIGFCKDIDTADYFFKDAVSESMPYLTPLQLNFIKKYLANTWQITHDYQRVKHIWLVTWKHYESRHTSNSSVSSSLNDSFLSIFFSKYRHFSPAAFGELQTLVADYSKIRPVDEPFINVLLSKSTSWHNSETFQYILATANSHQFSKTNVFYRCCLKATGAVKIDPDSILSLFRQLLATNAASGMKYIAHADWVALRDATVNSSQLFSFENPGERIDLYFKLWKLCSPYFISLENFKNYIYKDIKLNYNYSRIYQQMPNIRSDDLHIPEIRYMRRNSAIENYIGYAY